MPELSEGSKGIFSKMFSLFRGKQDGDSITENSSSTDLLSGIYKLLVKRENRRLLESKNSKKDGQQEEREEEKRHKEILKALTVKRPAKKKVEEKLKEEPKEKKLVEPQPTAATTTQPTPAQTTPRAAELPTTPKITTPKTTATPAPAPKPTVTSVPEIPLPSLPTAAKIIAPAVVATTLASAVTNVIAKEEGVLKDKKTGQVAAYWDPPGQKNLVSVGYGHQIKNEEYKQGYIEAGDEKITIKGEKGIDTRMTLDQAKKLLSVDVPKYEKAAKDPLGESWNKLNDKQKTALISYAYNVGSTSGLVKLGLKDLINKGDIKGAADLIREKGIRTAKGQFMPELDKRRRREADLFEADLKPILTSPNLTGQQIDTTSSENKLIKKELNDQSAMSQTINNVSVNSTQEQQKTTGKVDDRSTFERKRTE